MTRLRMLRAGGVVVGVAVLGLAGSVLGGRWWLVALAGAANLFSGRTGSLVHAVATLALAGAAAGADELWLVPLLVLGVVAASETAAMSGRTTRVRSRVRSGPALVMPLAAAGLSAAVLGLSSLAPAGAVPTALAAALAATALLAATRS